MDTESIKEIIFGIIFVSISIGIALYTRSKSSKKILEIKFNKTKSVKSIIENFNDIKNSGIGTDDVYREYSEIKGKIQNIKEIITPFSNKPVAYFKSKIIQITVTEERYYDDGRWRTKTVRREEVLSENSSGNYIVLNDGSCDQNVIVDVNNSDLHISETLNRVENIDQFKRDFNKFSPNFRMSLNGIDFNFGNTGVYGRNLSYKLIEETIPLNSDLYAIGDIYVENDQLHIGKPLNSDKPFIVTDKTESELISNINKEQKDWYFISGLLFVIGLFVLF